ncbi:hypothetical protein L0F63_001616, partial [Massospora cicadina]
DLKQTSCYPSLIYYVSEIALSDERYRHPLWYLSIWEWEDDLIESQRTFPKNYTYLPKMQ